MTDDEALELCARLTSFTVRYRLPAEAEMRVNGLLATQWRDLKEWADAWIAARPPGATPDLGEP